MRKSNDNMTIPNSWHDGHKQMYIRDFFYSNELGIIIERHIYQFKLAQFIKKIFDISAVFLF